MLSEQMESALAVLGQKLAAVSRREQGLARHVEDPATITAFVDLWALPDPTEIPRAARPGKHRAGDQAGGS